MTKDFSIISEIKSLREDISRLSARESELSQPILSNLELIPIIYGWFKEIAVDLPKRDKSILNKEFIFIILFLYSPGTLAGGKMKNGLRSKIGDVLGIKGKTSISDKLDTLVFYYKMYKYFRNDLNHIYTTIMNRIQGDATMY